MNWKDILALIVTMIVLVLFIGLATSRDQLRTLEKQSIDFDNRLQQLETKNLATENVLNYLSGVLNKQ